MRKTERVAASASGGRTHGRTQVRLDGAVLELTHNWGVDAYELGTAYGHIALEVADAKKACEEIRARGGKVVREAGPMKHGTTVIAFVEDPDGYKIELIERKVDHA